MVGCQRWRRLRSTHAVQGKRVGVDVADRVIRSRLLDAHDRVPARPVHVCGADGDERPRVPRRAAVQRVDGIRDARADAVVEPPVRCVSRGSLVRRYGDNDAVRGRLCRRARRGLVHAVQRRLRVVGEQRGVHAMQRGLLRRQGLGHLLRLRRRAFLWCSRCGMHGVAHMRNWFWVAVRRVQHPGSHLRTVRRRFDVLSGGRSLGMPNRAHVRGRRVRDGGANGERKPRLRRLSGWPLVRWQRRNHAM